MADRTRLYGNSGMDLVYPTSNDVEHVIAAIRARLELVGSNVPVLASAKFSLEQCGEVLKAFPAYGRCFQESGSLVILSLSREPLE